MLRLRHGMLTWSDTDAFTLAKLIGHQEAARLSCPYNPAIVKWCERRLRISTILGAMLEGERLTRKRLRDAFGSDDYKGWTQIEPVALRSLSAWASVFPHVRAGVRRLHAAKLDAYLIADQVGLGKTPLSILVAEARGLITRQSRQLIITTNSAKYQWERAVRQWATLNVPVTVLDGTVPQQLAQTQARGWVIAHWEALVHARTGLVRHPWDVVIADEAHFATNRKTQRASTLFQLDARLRLALTATPYSKGPDELFSLLRFLYPDRYRSFWRYFHMHVKATPKNFGGYDVQGAKRPKLLKWELDPFTLRRTKRQVRGSLPSITRVARIVSLTPKGRREYERMRKAVFAEIAADGGKKHIPIFNMLARTTRLRQYLLDPGLLGGSEPSVKYAAVRDLLLEIQAPTVVFTYFAKASRRLAQYLKRDKLRCGFIDGDVKPKQRDAVQRAFHAGKYDVLCVVMQAGGTALNLGRYGYCIHMDLPWTPKDLEQTEGRVDRPVEGTGEMVQTTAYRVVVKDSYEEKMQQRLIDRHKEFRAVFTVNELRELFG